MRYLIALMALVIQVSAQTNQTFTFTNSAGGLETGTVWSVVKEGVLIRRTNGVAKIRFETIRSQDRVRLRQQIPIRNHSLVYTNSDGNFFYEHVSINVTNRFGELQLKVERQTSWDGKEWYSFSGFIIGGSVKATRAEALRVTSDIDSSELNLFRSTEKLSSEGLKELGLDPKEFDDLDDLINHFEAVIPASKLRMLAHSGLKIAIIGGGQFGEWSIPDSDLSLLTFLDYIAKTKATIPDGVSVDFDKRIPKRIGVK